MTPVLPIHVHGKHAKAVWLGIHSLRLKVSNSLTLPPSNLLKC